MNLFWPLSLSYHLNAPLLESHSKNFAAGFVDTDLNSSFLDMIDLFICVKLERKVNKLFYSSTKTFLNFFIVFNLDGGFFMQ